MGKKEMENAKQWQNPKSDQRDVSGNRSHSSQSNTTDHHARYPTCSTVARLTPAGNLDRENRPAGAHVCLNLLSSRNDAVSAGTHVVSQSATCAAGLSTDFNYR